MPVSKGRKAGVAGFLRPPSYLRAAALIPAGERLHILGRAPETGFLAGEWNAEKRSFPSAKL